MKKLIFFFLSLIWLLPSDVAAFNFPFPVEAIKYLKDIFHTSKDSTQTIRTHAKLQARDFLDSTGTSIIGVASSSDSSWQTGRMDTLKVRYIVAPDGEDTIWFLSITVLRDEVYIDSVVYMSKSLQVDTAQGYANNFFTVKGQLKADTLTGYKKVYQRDFLGAGDWKTTLTNAAQYDRFNLSAGNKSRYCYNFDPTTVESLETEIKTPSGTISTDSVIFNLAMFALTAGATDTGAWMITSLSTNGSTIDATPNLDTLGFFAMSATQNIINYPTVKIPYSRLGWIANGDSRLSLLRQAGNAKDTCPQDIRLFWFEILQPYWMKE